MAAGLPEFRSVLSLSAVTFSPRILLRFFFGSSSFLARVFLTGVFISTLPRTLVPSSFLYSVSTTLSSGSGFSNTIGFFSTAGFDRTFSLRTGFSLSFLLLGALLKLRSIVPRTLRLEELSGSTSLTSGAFTTFAFTTSTFLGFSATLGTSGAFTSGVFTSGTSTFAVGAVGVAIGAATSGVFTTGVGTLGLLAELSFI